jgi:hypothetical protein
MAQATHILHRQLEHHWQDHQLLVRLRLTDCESESEQTLSSNLPSKQSVQLLVERLIRGPHVRRQAAKFRAGWRALHASAQSAAVITGTGSATASQAARRAGPGSQTTLFPGHSQVAFQGPTRLLAWHAHVRLLSSTKYPVVVMIDTVTAHSGDAKAG